jgi:hypothetical protein
MTGVIVSDRATITANELKTTYLTAVPPEALLSTAD